MRIAGPVLLAAAGCLLAPVTLLAGAVPGAAEAEGPHPSWRPPTRLVARVGDRSVALHWDEARGEDVIGYHVDRALVPTGTWHQQTQEPVGGRSWADLEVTNGVAYLYRVRAVHRGRGAASIRIEEPTPEDLRDAPEARLSGAAARGPDSRAGAPSEAIQAEPRAFASDDAFLDLLQATAFDYFWCEANPGNGLVRDRSRQDSFCSIAAVGFGLTAVGIGIDHGWITREEGRARVLTTLRTFHGRPQGDGPEGTIGYRGWFYHFLDLETGLRFNDRIELSSIDTALFLAGALDVREYFDTEHADERAVRELVDALVGRVDWGWMTNGGETLAMGWMPGRGFLEARWTGYNEASLLYLLGLGAPANPLPESGWEAWTRGYRWATHEGLSYVEFAPLFGHQYTQCWVDLREVADAFMRGRGLTYFENSRRATLAQRAYAVANPGRFAGYGENQWGFSACDGPNGYAARGAPPPENDDGTIAPTAAGGSLAFTPAESMAVLRHLYDAHRPRLWTAYGFRDAFNLEADWWGPDVLGIDQGPILLMIENHRTGRVWDRLRQSPVIQRGLQRAGFRPASGGRER